MPVELSWPLPQAADDAWQHLTDVRRLPEWLGVPVRVDARVGVVEIDHGDNTVCVSEILECDASSRRLRVTWEFPDEPTSQVAFAVVAGGVGGDGESSELRLHHENLGELVDEYRDGWRTHLTYFAASLSGEPLAMSEFWNVHAALSGGPE